MITPDIQNYQSIRDFLRDLYEINKAESAKTSFRFFAMKLKWPVSLLNDIMSGRKRLTISKALELGLFLKLDAVDIERLVFLSLQQSEDKDTFEFFSKKLKEELDNRSYFSTAKVKEPFPEDFQIIDESIYSDISLLAIFDIIAWAKGKITPERIGDLLYTFPELRNPEVMQQKIKRLVKAKLIEPIFKKDQVEGFKYNSKRLFFVVNPQTAPLMAQYAENYKRMVQNPDAKAWIGSGFVMLSQDKILEVKKRIVAFRNWILSLDSRAANQDHGNQKLLFQFDLNLFSILYDRENKISNLTKWGEEVHQKRK